VATAVRSCWAAAFAADPLARLRASGLVPEDLALGVVILPELCPDAGGTATVAPDLEVRAEAVAGHPGPLLAGWAEGMSGSGLAELIGGRAARQVAGLATQVFRLLGDRKIEWAIQNGSVWLLQSLAPEDRRGAGAGAAADACAAALAAAPVTAGDGTAAAIGPDERWSHREWMPLLAAAVPARGQRLRGRPAAPGVAAGRLVPCRPHERPPASGTDAILLVDRPVPALAPLLFGARGLIARTGAASSHLAEVARSLAVPMVTGCELPTGSTADLGSSDWLAAIDGTSGEVTLLPG
jgi:phosphohistidine swiveling domain-containing protein